MVNPWTHRILMIVQKHFPPTWLDKQFLATSIGSEGPISIVSPFDFRDPVLACVHGSVSRGTVQRLISSGNELGTNKNRASMMTLDDRIPCCILMEEGRHSELQTRVR